TTSGSSTSFRVSAAAGQASIGIVASTHADCHSRGEGIGVPRMSRKRKGAGTERSGAALSSPPIASSQGSITGASEVGGEAMLPEPMEQLAGLGLCQREPVARDLHDALERLAQARVGSPDLRQHLLQELFVQELFPPHLELLRSLDILRNLIQDAERERRYRFHRIPDLHDDIAIRRKGEVLFEEVSGCTQLDELRAVVDLVGEAVRRLIDVDGADEAQVGCENDALIAELDLGGVAAGANLHRREETGEIVLDAGEVHLIEDEVVRAGGRVLLPGALELIGRFFQEPAELSVVVHPI